MSVISRVALALTALALLPVGAGSPLGERQAPTQPPKPARVSGAYPRPEASENARAQASRGESEAAERDNAALRREDDLFWFGGEATPEYLDFKRERAKDEVSRWSNTFALKGDRPAIPGGSGTWVSVGPTKSTFSVYSGQAPAHPDVDSGRPAEGGLLTHPTNPQILYLAASGGGLWKTTNADPATSGDWTWTPLTDALPASASTGNVSIGAVAMSPADPETIFLGLGDSFDAAGKGLYKSSNGGSSWTELGAIGATTRVHTLFAVDGTTLIVGGNAGMWRSTNGGTSFTNISLGGSTSGDVWSVTRVGTSTSNLVATRLSSSTGTFWYSSDGGASWSQAALDGAATAQAPGRATVAGSASSPFIVYAIANKNPASGRLMASGVFKSTDAGHNWTFVPAPTVTGGLFQPFNNSGDGDQAEYNQLLAVDPDDATRLFVGANLSLYRSMDSGTSWTQMTSWDSTNLPYAHADFHTAAWSKTGPKTLFTGSDGGLCVLPDPFRASPPFTANPSVYATTDVTFVDNRRNRGLSSQLVYHLGSTTASTPPDARARITVGIQDLSSRVRVDEGTGLVNSTTYNDPTGTGDGFGTLINSADGNKMMVSSYYARPLRSTNGGTSWTSAFLGITGAGNSSLAPFHTRLYPGGGDPTGNTVYTATNLVIYKTTDWAATGWTPLPMTGFGGTLIRNFNASASDPNVLIIAANSGNVWLSANGGTTWTNPKGGDVTGGVLNLAYVWVDSTNSQNLYATSSTLGAVSHLFKSSNGGSTWAPIDVSNGFPFGVPVHVIQNDPSNGSRLLAGTDFGVYISENGGATWSRYGTGLPLVAVRDLYIAPDGSFVRAATFGRGVWELSTSAAPTPTVSSLTPNSGPVGTSVTVGGTNLTGATAVTFNGTPATTFTVNSATAITATVPAGASTGTVTVTTPGGTAVGPSFTVTTVSSAPVINSFTATPGTIPQGNSSTLSWNVSNAASLSISGVGAVSGTSINVSPGTTTQYVLTASNGMGTATANATVTVKPLDLDASGGSPDVLDMAILARAYSGTGIATTLPGADFDGDGDVDDVDLNLFLSLLGF